MRFLQVLETAPDLARSAEGENDRRLVNVSSGTALDGSVMFRTVVQF